MAIVTNSDIRAVFDQIADLLEFQGGNIFRVRAYRNAAHTIGTMVESLATILRDKNQNLTDFEGIGSDLAKKIEVLIKTGGLPLLDELRAKTPAVVFDLMRVPGLGPKKVKVLVKELHIDSLDALEQACREERVRSVKGFGKKTESSILENIAFAKSVEHDRILWEEADVIVQELLAWMRKCPATHQAEGAGSWRRGKETVGDIDILIDSNDAHTVMDHLQAWQECSDVLLRGETKTSIRGPRGIQVDLRVVEHDSFGSAWQYFTGSKDHNVRLRSRAREKNLTINEYGVFGLVPNVDPNAKPVKGDHIAGSTEQDVYEAVGLPWIPPELREGTDEITKAEEGDLPELVSLDDIRGDLHMHTNATDGELTLGEMVQAAIQRGLSYIAITDHSQRVTMANGLDPTRLLNQWGEIDRLNEALAGQGNPTFTVLKGIEVDILEKGGLDLPDTVLMKADWVVASLHYGQHQSREKITKRIIEAVENPYVSVIGHPTGRLINRRPAYDVDMEALIAAAAQTGTFLEINANPWRLDLNVQNALAAKRSGVKMVISTDAHSEQGLDVMRCGILQARRAFLEAKDIVNTNSLSNLKKMTKH